VAVPDAFELRTVCAESGDDGGGAAVWAVTGCRDPEVGHLNVGLEVLIGAGIDQPLGGIGEPPVDAAAGEAVVAGLVTEQHGREPVLHQGLGYVGDHLGRCVIQAVEHPHQSGADVI